MTAYSKPADYLWIPMVLIFMIPVFMYSSIHTEVDDDHVVQGPLLTGREALDSLLSESFGKPVIVNFWATWCTPCVGELPLIDRVYRTMEGSIAAVAVDIGDLELETLLGFREEFDLSMPVVWLNESDAAQLKDEWDLSDVLPLTVVFDSGGNEIERAAGTRDESFFRSAVEGDSVPDTASVHQPPELELHINVVGLPADSLTERLMAAAVELAGEEGVDFFDPSVRADSISMEELYLPNPGYSYAQPCVGDACGRLVRTSEELHQAVLNLSN